MALAGFFTYHLLCSGCCGSGLGLRDASQPFFLRRGLSPASLRVSRIVCTDYFSLERPSLGTIHEARDRGQGEARASDQGSVFSYQTSNVHWHSTGRLGGHPAIPQHNSCTRLSSLRRHSVQESCTRGRAPLI